jgi:hypothetical protein
MFLNRYMDQVFLETTVGFIVGSYEPLIFSYTFPPDVIDVFPMLGPLIGGTEVVVTGLDLDGGQRVLCRQALQFLQEMINSV